MSKEEKRPRATYRYTIWPDDGPPKTLGPFEAKVTLYPHPEEDDEEEKPRKSA